MDVLIAGCGYVGRALARRLAGSGHAVWGLSRHPAVASREAGPEPPAGRFHRLAADLACPASLAAALQSLPAPLDAVVYAASADGFDEAAYRAAYVNGPRHLLAALGDHADCHGRAPARLVFTSSTGVWGQGGGEWVDETSPATAEHLSGTLLRAGEEVFLDGPFPAVIARLGGIYGPGRTRLVDRVASGEARCAEGEARWTNRIHRDDAAGALAHLLELAEPHAVYAVVDREPAEVCAVLTWIAERLGVEPPPRVAGAGSERGQRSNKRVSSARLVACGYAHLYPSFREGYDEMLRHREG